LIVHQTWKNAHIDTWPDQICDSVEKWLEFVVDVPMAYFLWDDEGVIQFLEEYEPRFIPQFSSLAANVERSDVFRIMVSNYIGGIVSLIPPSG
jgi:mannosyltransferase OCH1-like enzyme